jgi:hypothetical protein
MGRPRGERTGEVAQRQATNDQARVAQWLWATTGKWDGCGEKETGDPKVTVQFSNYSNIFKRLELIRSKGVLPEFEKNQIKYVFAGY